MQTTIEQANALLKRIEQEIQNCVGNADNLEDAQNLLLDAVSALQAHAEKIPAHNPKNVYGITGYYGEQY